MKEPLGIKAIKKGGHGDAMAEEAAKEAEGMRAQARASLDPRYLSQRRKGGRWA
jgi:hypothetical protein